MKTKIHFPLPQSQSDERGALLRENVSANWLSKALRSGIVGCGAAADGSPRREPWVCVIGGQAPEGRKTDGLNSAAPAGAFRGGAFPTAHAVGYRLAQLRCWNFSVLFAVGIFLLAVTGCSKKSADQPAEKPAAEKAEAGPSVKRGADGESIVVLDAETQKRIALQTETLAATEWTPEVKGFGRVVDTATLAAALADLETTRGAALVSGKELARLKALAEQGNASDRVLQTAEAAAKHDELALDAARAKFVMGWGKKLADDSGDTLKSLAAGEAVLVQIALPGGDALKSSPHGARIASLNDAAKFVNAEFFDASAGVDPLTQQQSFLFLAKQSSLAPGAAVTGFLKTDGAATSGVTVPADAVLRHEGKAWIYLQTGADEFSRREITLDRAADGGWFSSELSATNKVVTSGAQAVLSTELSAGGFTTGARD